MRVRFYRTNPMDAVTRGPDVRGPLVAGLIAAAALVGFGLWSDHKVTTRRAVNVAQAVAAQGLGVATVEPVRKAGCGRARGLFRWRTASAVGMACAGPRDAV